MSVPDPSELDPLLTRHDHRQLSCCCKLSYKPRKFSSKGAVLVLVWQFLVFCGVSIVKLDLSIIHKRSIRTSFGVTPVIPLLLAAIISGWLADTKVGRSRVVQTGLFLTWLGVVLVTLVNILTLSTDTASNAAMNGIFIAVEYVALFATYGGAVFFFTNVVQFGLEQMPDASSNAMTAYISWFTIATALGEGVKAVVASKFSPNCITQDGHVFKSIIGCTLLSVAMCSKFLFSHWLIDHRQNHHPLKTVYRVLKFAKQHKYPVNRSAFTYWEEEIPSRIDLGKSKYGGPFTTEEVEDVKTFFRILLILTLIYVFAIIVAFPIVAVRPTYEKSCHTKLIFSIRGFFAAAVFLTYEYVVYPCIKFCYKLSMLKKAGLCMFFGVVITVTLFVYAVLTEAGVVDLDSILIKANHSIEIVGNWLSHVIVFVLFSTILQFVYSQAPEHMKGFLLLWTWSLVGIATATSYKKNIECSQHKYCRVSVTSVALPLSLLVFAVYCCVARRYKRRERDEPCNERAIIEEIYGRRVEHNAIEESDSK